MTRKYTATGRQKRIDSLYRLLDAIGRSAYVKVKPIIEELLTLHNLIEASATRQTVKL